MEPLNWGGTLPANDGTADVEFKLPILSTTMDHDWSIRSMVWGVGSRGGGISPSGEPDHTLTIHGGVTNLGGIGNLTIEVPVVLAAFQRWHDATTPARHGIENPGTDVYELSGSGGIRKTGSGTLRLYSNQSTGGLLIEEGAIQVEGPSGLGPAANQITIDGGILRFRQLFGGVEIVPQGIVLGTAGGTIEGERAELEFRSPISGPGGLTLQSAALADYTDNVFTISGANTYEGGTMVKYMQVVVTGSEQALGTGDVTLETGALLSLAAPTNLAPGRKVAMQRGSVLDFAAGQYDPTSLIDSDPEKTTGGVLALTAQDHTTTLDMAAIGNGKLYLGASGAAVYKSATLGVGADNAYRLGGGRFVNSVSRLTFDGGANVFTGANSMIVGAKRPESEPYLSNNRALIENTIELLHANDYTGGTTLVDGTLLLGNDNALGSGPLRISGGELGAVKGPRTIGNPLVFDENSPGVNLGFRSQEPMTFTGAVDLGGAEKTLWGNFAIHTAFDGDITRGSLRLRGGNWEFGGENGFGTLTLMEKAALQVDRAENLGSPTGFVRLINGTLIATAGFTFSKSLAIDSGSIDVEAGRLVFTGNLTGGGPLTKLGDGMFVLKGASKTLGNITIEDGELRLEDTGISAPQSVAVRTGATLSGNGILGATTVERGGRIEPGTDLPGDLTFKSGLTLKETAILEFDLGLTLFDQILLTGGTFTKNSGLPVIIEVADAGGLAMGQTYTLIDWSAATAASSIVPSAFALSEQSFPGTISVVEKKLQYTVVPEPGSALALAAGVILLFGRRSRSRRGDGL